MYEAVLIGVFVTAAATFVALFFITAPYGRHTRPRWGPTMPTRLAWVVMECPAVLAFAAFFAQGEHRSETVPLVLLALWMSHYVHRSFIYPLRMRARPDRPTPVSIVAMGFTFNVANAYLNGTWISTAAEYEPGWLVDPRFLIGAVVFATGWAINRWADAVLRRLRQAGSGYKIPRGGLYELVSCPNYLGEMIEWGGWAVATWSLAGLSFAVFTVANLLPRAVSNHRWYRETFPDYPPSRRAAIPYLL